MRTVVLLGVVAWHVASFELAAADVSQLGVYASNFSESLQLFGPKSFQIIHEAQPGNLIYSPLSASMVLTMASLGSEGQTRYQMRRGLALPIDDRQTGREINAIVSRPNQGYELHAANTIFYNKDSEPNELFIRATRTIFKAQAQEVDFANSEDASRTINEWCANNTNQRIKEIIDPNSIGEDTELLLVNAIYFKGSWKLPFESSLTEPRDFHVNGNTIRKVPTMVTEGEYRYAIIPKFRVEYVELPYESAPNTQPGDELSMIIILPFDNDGLSDLMKNFHKIDLNLLLDGEPRSMILTLPKFKIESTIRLRKPLERLGLFDMFTKEANFSGISDKLSLRVTDVLQKSFIEVNEKGTEAAAATGAGFQNRLMPLEVSVDHPFVVVIMKRDGTLLFTATVADPRNESSTQQNHPKSNRDWTWPSDI